MGTNYELGLAAWQKAIDTDGPLPAVDVELLRQTLARVRANEDGIKIVKDVGPVVWTRMGALNSLLLIGRVEETDEWFAEAAVFPWRNNSKIEDFVTHMENKKGAKNDSV